MIHLKENSVYLIMGSQNTNKDPYHLVEQAILAGIDMFQYREKGFGALQGEEKIALGKRLRQLCKKYDVPFVVNDDLQLAILLEADGIHIGQDDIDVHEARRQLDKDMFIGLSTSTLDEAMRAEKAGVDYIGFGPIYPTTTKEDAKPSIGLHSLKQVRDAIEIPIVAIGGIQARQAAEVFDSGATAVAMISALTKSSNLQKTIAQIKRSHS